MAQPPMTPDELAKVTAVRAGLQKAKDGMKDAFNAASDLMAIELAAGRQKAYNAAFRARGDFRRLHGEIEVAHADASQALDDNTADAGSVIMAPGR